MAPRTQMPAAGRATAGKAGALGTRGLPVSTLRRQRDLIRSHCAAAAT